MIVLSLFDGMGCGYEALKRAGIYVEKYYASEIDKYPIKIAKKNHPDIIHLGDVENWEEWDIPRPNLIIGGSPCQGFSFAGNQLAFDDPRSKLFFTMTDIIDHYGPERYLLENVRMKQDHLDVVTDFMNCGDPHLLNSALVSAQNRNRYYWYNWDAPDPGDRGIMLKDIIHETVERSDLPDGWYKWWKEKADFQLSKKHSALNPDKAICMTARQYASWNGNYMMETLAEYVVPFDKTLQILDKEVDRGKIGYFENAGEDNRVYYIHDQAVTLTDEHLLGHIQKPRGKNNDGLKPRDKSPSITSNAWEQNNSLLFGCITPDRVNKRQNGQRFNEGQKFYTLTAQDQHGILVEGYIRKLTPIECERLQTLPDNYTEGVSNTQRYKMIGNGWTVDVIAHLFRHMPLNELERMLQ